MYDIKGGDFCMEQEILAGLKVKKRKLLKKCNRILNELDEVLEDIDEVTTDILEKKPSPNLKLITNKTERS